ncbi:MAG: SDR family NAD(P)-dependent oxidoreductase [Betaproteobacteria bacterium]
MALASYEGRTAVVTGAGSGLGLAIARALSAAGAQLVLADINTDDLAVAEKTLRAAGGTCTSCPTDVGWDGSVAALAEHAAARYGAVHLLFNNAGVALAAPVWESSAADWDWLLRVNVMGIVHGIRNFVPAMLAHGQPAHVINTASVAGLITPPGFSAYTVTKHAAVALSEVLYHDLRAADANVGVSVLCPAYFPSRIADSARNRPAALRTPGTDPAQQDTETEAQVRHAVERGKLSADDIARITLESILAGRFYILPHGNIKPSIEARMQDILLDRAPTNPMGQQKPQAAA